MIARFDGASSRRGFSTRSVMRCTPRPRSARLVDRRRCRSSRRPRAARARRRAPGPSTRSKTSIICFSAGGFASITSSPRITANGSSPTRFLRDEHGVPEAERLALPHVGHVDQLRDLADLLELRRLAALLEKALELDGDVEVILDRVLAAAGDDDDVVDARRRRPPRRRTG